MQQKYQQSYSQYLPSYLDEFKEPSELSPARLHDLTIYLNPKPVNLRPYRFPYYHKVEEQKQVADMMSSSIIQTKKSSVC